MTVDEIKGIITLVVLSVIPCLMISGIIRSIRQRRQEKEELHRKVHDAMANIMADGVVTGPKGSYVPHHSWGTGLGSATLVRTRPPQKAGPYGMPKP